MITPEYCQLFARYARWMNERMYAALATLSDGERKHDRAAFFESIHRRGRERYLARRFLRARGCAAS